MHTLKVTSELGYALLQYPSNQKEKSLRMTGSCLCFKKTNEVIYNEDIRVHLLLVTQTLGSMVSVLSICLCEKAAKSVSKLLNNYKVDFLKRVN